MWNIGAVHSMHGQQLCKNWCENAEYGAHGSGVCANLEGNCTEVNIVDIERSPPLWKVLIQAGSTSHAPGQRDPQQFESIVWIVSAWTNSTSIGCHPDLVLTAAVYGWPGVEQHSAANGAGADQCDVHAKNVDVCGQ